MRAYITTDHSLDHNPDGRRGTLVLDADHGQVFRYGFDWEYFIRDNTIRKAILRRLREEVEDWMLGLPGDITGIEEGWEGLVVRAFEEQVGRAPRLFRT